MADKIGARELQQRALREAKFARKSSDGGVDGHARLVAGPLTSPDLGRASPVTIRGSDSIAAEAGIKSGPSEAKPKRGRPRIGEPREKHQPWVALGMSERTWYRRKAEAAKLKRKSGA